MSFLNQRLDSWKNFLTGLGSFRDKGSFTHFNPDYRLSYEYLESLYMHDDIAARVCELIPHEMLRQGFNITVDGEEFLWPELKEFLLDALIKSRVYGASFLYIGAQDGLEQHEPLGRAKNIDLLHVLTPKEIKLEGEKLYLKNRLEIHESRILKFYAGRSINNQLPVSVLERIYPVLQQFNTAWQATAHLMTDAAQEGCLS